MTLTQYVILSQSTSKKLIICSVYLWQIIFYWLIFERRHESDRNVCTRLQLEISDMILYFEKKYLKFSDYLVLVIGQDKAKNLRLSHVFILFRKHLTVDPTADVKDDDTWFLLLS